MIAFEDLGWVAIDAEGSAIELSADSEYRMNAIAEATGIKRAADLSDTAQDDTRGELGHVLTERHVGEASPEEATALGSGAGLR